MKYFLKLKKGGYPTFSYDKECRTHDLDIYSSTSILYNFLHAYFHRDYENYQGFESKFVINEIKKRIDNFTVVERKKIKNFKDITYLFFGVMSHKERLKHLEILLSVFGCLDAIFFKYRELFQIKCDKQKPDFNYIYYPVIWSSLPKLHKFINSLKSKYREYDFSTSSYKNIDEFISDIKIMNGYDICQFCGDLFLLKDKDKLCNSCHIKENNKQGQCIICGTNFKFKKGKKTCSTKCRVKLLRQNNKKGG